jgi:hypothetical protein
MEPHRNHPRAAEELAMPPREKPAGVSDESWSIWLKVRANSERLDTCPGPHEFAPKEDKIFSRHVCAKCGGEVEGTTSRWYKLGLDHANRAHVVKED